MHNQVNGAALKNAVISGANNINKHKKDVDALNVFPVPDGDTGTNMSMTFTAAARELQVLDSDDVSLVASRTASACLRGARGNSGVILSLIFRGISNGFKGHTQADGKLLANSLRLASQQAYNAVMKPTEGTILTVIRCAAEAVEHTDDGSFVSVLRTAYDAACEALAKTPEMLPVLKQSGVVDAGGQGLVYILEGMLFFLESGQTVQSVDDGFKAQSEQKSVVAGASGDIRYGYCSEFLISRENAKGSDAKSLKAYLESIGDCVVVVEDDDIIKVHVHSNEPGNVIQAALKIGELTNIKIDNMRYQHRNADVGIDNKKEEAKAGVDAEPVEATEDYGFVAVCSGEGFEELYRELGAAQVVSGGQTMNPSTDDILSAVEATPARTVFVLPNNKNIIMAAEQAAALATRKVYVLPTRNVTQGIGAMLSFEGSDDVEAELLKMTKASDNVHTAQVTFAARDSEVLEQRIKKGEILGMEDGKITLVEKDIVNAAYRTARRLVKKYDGTVVTVYYGKNVDVTTAEVLTQRLSQRFPNVEVSAVYGGQPVYYFIVSVE